jgi:hypothetical protein
LYRSCTVDVERLTADTWSKLLTLPRKGSFSRYEGSLNIVGQHSTWCHQHRRLCRVTKHHSPHAGGNHCGRRGGLYGRTHVDVCRQGCSLAFESGGVLGVGLAADTRVRVDVLNCSSLPANLIAAHPFPAHNALSWTPSRGSTRRTGVWSCSALRCRTRSIASRLKLRIVSGK